MVAALLGAGADPTIRNKDGKTAMELARAFGHVDAVEALEEACAQAGIPSD